ncbi:hypothetical protein ACS0TY_008795 [Phlomoides rotata]
MAPTNNLIFKVCRKNPELIPPAKSTPHEFKPLSDIDDQEGLRIQIPIIHFYRKCPSMQGKDPVKVIRDAIAKALVFYYPFAGRLREASGRKLVVECTGEGVVFIEADADVTLQEFGDALYPPFPCMEELLYHVPGSNGITNSPLLLIQVTRLKCNGFISACRINHTMCDSIGAAQFLCAIGEYARGAKTPSILPIWERQLLNARIPPRLSCTHHEYNIIPHTKENLISLDNTVRRSFFFGAKDISALRHLLPPNLRRSSKFQILAASIWRCRTIALSLCPNEDVKFLCTVNTRQHLPKGYYGNAVIFPAAITTAEKLSKSPLHYAIELIRKTISEATEEYVKSVADLMVIRGRPNFTELGTYLVFDLTRAGFSEVDFGWGKAVYSGPAEDNVDLISGAASFLTSVKNKNGEDEMLILICLPSNSMEVFVKELQLLMESARRSSISSAL